MINTNTLLKLINPEGRSLLNGSEQFFCIADTATIFGLSEMSIRRRVADGRLQVAAYVRRSPVFHRNEILRCIENEITPVNMQVVKDMIQTKGQPLKFKSLRVPACHASTF